MKKLMFAIGLGLISGSVYAATIGCMTYDDSGCTIAGFLHNGNGQGMPVLSSTSIAGLTPYIGQTLICNTCANVSGSYALCIATATTGSSKFIVSGSTNGVVVCK